MSTAGQTYLATATGVLRSSSGAGWSIETTGFSNVSRCERVTTDANDPVPLYVAAEQLLRSTDQGHSYQELFVTGAAAGWRIHVVVPLGSRIFAGTEGRLLVSGDGGGSFAPTQIAGSPRTVEDILVVDKGPPATLLLATDSGVFYTKDEGASFEAQLQGLTSLDVRAVERHPSGGFIAGTVNGAFTTPALGSAWTPCGLRGEINDLLLHDDLLLAATNEGVFWTRDATGWQQLPGLAGRWPNSLAIDRDGTLLVATRGDGLHRAALP